MDLTVKTEGCGLKMKISGPIKEIVSKMLEADFRIEETDFFMASIDEEDIEYSFSIEKKCFGWEVVITCNATHEAFNKYLHQLEEALPKVSRPPLPDLLCYSVEGSGELTLKNKYGFAKLTKDRIVATYFLRVPVEL